MYTRRYAGAFQIGLWEKAESVLRTRLVKSLESCKQNVWDHCYTGFECQNASRNVSTQGHADDVSMDIKILSGVEPKASLAMP